MSKIDLREYSARAIKDMFMRYTTRDGNPNVMKWITRGGKDLNMLIELRINPNTSAEDIRIYTNGKPCTIFRNSNRRFIHFNDVLVNIDVLISILLAKENNPLLKHPMNDLSLVTSHYTRTRHVCLKYAILVHKCVDLYNPAKNETYIKMSHEDACEMLGCSSGTLWDMIHPNFAGKIGYRGYVARAHDSGIEFTEDKCLASGEDAEHIGIYLVVKQDNSDIVHISDSIRQVAQIISDDTLLVSVEDVETYFKRTNSSDTINGYLIRRIDDIYGTNVRFSKLSVGAE